MSTSAGRCWESKVSLTGKVGGLAPLMGVDLEVTNGPSSTLHKALPGLPLHGDLSLAGRLMGSQAKLSLPDLHARDAEGKVTGNLALGLADRPSLSGSLSATRLVLPREETRPPAKQGSGAAAGERHIFPDVAVPTDLLRRFDADLDLRLGQLVSGKLDLRDLAATVRLADGELAITDLGWQLAGSRYEGSLTLAAGTGEPTSSLALHADPLDLGQLLTAFGATDMLQVKGRLRASLEARGASLRSMVAALDGRIDAVFANGRVNAQAVRQPIVGLKRFVGSVLAPLTSDWVTLNCLAGSFAVAKGVARPDVLLLDSSLTSAVGTGKIDLVEERYALTVEPRAKGLNLDFGVPIRITGPLDDPQLGIDEKGAMAGVGGLVGKLLFPPALIAGMIDLAGKDSPCVMAMKNAPARDAAATKGGARGKDLLKGLSRDLQQLIPKKP